MKFKLKLIALAVASISNIALAAGGTASDGSYATSIQTAPFATPCRGAWLQCAAKAFFQARPANRPASLSV